MAAHVQLPLDFAVIYFESAHEGLHVFLTSVRGAAPHQSC